MFFLHRILIYIFFLIELAFLGLNTVEMSFLKIIGFFVVREVHYIVKECERVMSRRSVCNFIHVYLLNIFKLMYKYECFLKKILYQH